MHHMSDCMFLFQFVDFVVNVCSIHCRCNPKSINEKGGAYCEVDVYEEISSDTGSQTTDEDSGRLPYVSEFSRCIKFCGFRGVVVNHEIIIRVPPTHNYV